MTRIDALKFGMAGGMVCALLAFLITLISVLSHVGLSILTLLSDILIGYQVTVMGSLVAFAYGFLAGFIKYFLIGFFYNLFHTLNDEGM